jgi:hypothetical protein
MNFFRADVYNDDVMTPIQREFIRLAQIFKSQMIAEIELKQRVVERALIQNSVENEEESRRIADEEHGKAEKVLRDAIAERQELASEVQQVLLYGELPIRLRKLIKDERDLWRKIDAAGIEELLNKVGPSGFYDRLDEAASDGDSVYADVRLSGQKAIRITFPLTPHPEDGWGGADVFVSGIGLDDDEAAKQWKGKLEYLLEITDGVFESYDDIKFSGEEEKKYDEQKYYRKKSQKRNFEGDELKPNAEVKVGMIANVVKMASNLHRLGQHVDLQAQGISTDSKRIAKGLVTPDKSKDALVDLVALTKRIIGFTKEGGKLRAEAYQAIEPLTAVVDKFVAVELRVSVAEQREKSSRVDLDHKKLLDYLIDEKEEKFIELVEGTRSHIAQIDNYLKRLAIALEDDFKVQFYDPAFEGVRAEGRDESVNFGQIERTTILTNNRTFAKVSPQASMEFDLPKRAPVVVEAMSGAKALMQDYGALVNDPTFVGLTGALSGAPAVGGAGNGSPPQVRPLFPTQGTDSQSSFLSGGPPGTPGGRQKTSLEQLIPDPAVYKIQTGTGFEIRPVIQPDGHSIMYDFNYLYTTNVREPVDPDEKHLGRIKQHYIHTQVQTSSFELREISRYQVALKVSRTSGGVPLLEDIPIAGVLFKPAPSAESSLQQNIILGQTTVYPTLFDLMGLRWSRHVADLDHMKLRELEHVVRGRNRSINDYVFDKASEKVDSFLDIEKDNDHFREDFYRQPSLPTPYHPNGYIYTKDGKEITDPTGRNFYRQDPRPEEYRIPQYDTLRRGPLEDYKTGRESFPVPVMPLQQMEPLEQIPAFGPQTYQQRSIPSDRRPTPPAESGTVSTRSDTRSAGNVRQINFEQPAADASANVRPMQAASNGLAPTPKKSWLVNRIFSR